MLRHLSLFLLGFLLHTSLCAQNSPDQSEMILGHWIMFEMKNADSAAVDFIYDGDKVPDFLTDVKITKKKAISTYNGRSRAARWKIKDGSIFFYFETAKSDLVCKIVSISDTELTLQQNYIMYDGTMQNIFITYKKK